MKTASPLPAPPRAVVVLYLLLCVFTWGLAAEAVVMLAACHTEVCAVPTLDLMSAAFGALVLFGVGLVLRRAGRAHGQPLRLLSWGLRSQVLLLVLTLLPILFVLLCRHLG